MAEFAAWLKDHAPRVLPKSPIGHAIANARRQWAALMRFTEHGFLNIDNNASERALRAVAVGRKNVIAFPKNQKARDLMTGAPAPVDARQLKDLGIKL